MIGALWLFLVNCVRRVKNLLRGLRRAPLGYVAIDLEGAIPEFAEAPKWWQRRFMQAQTPLSMTELHRRFRRIAREPRITGVLLRVQHLHLGWASLIALQREIAWLRTHGKRVVAAVGTPDTVTYEAIAGADEILMPPSGMLILTGFHREALFFKDVLDKLGVKTEVEAVSPYKSAAENLTRNDFSLENREQTERIFGKRFQAVIDHIAAVRKKTPDEVRKLIDRAPIHSQDAKDAGLVDALVYEDEWAEHLQHAPITEWDRVEKRLKLPLAKRHKKLVGLVRLEGTISSGKSKSLPIPIPLLGGRQAGSDSVIQAIRKAERNPMVSAVVLRVDSPGGDAFASDLMWREIVRLRRSKPVVVSMGNAAASGGYYVAAPANVIMAERGTLTGSIGVIAMRPKALGLLEKLGIHARFLERGERSGMFSALTEDTEEHRAAMRDIVQSGYALFKSRVKDGRAISEEKLEPLAGGRVWLGEEALEHKLVDALGGVWDAITKARELANLPPDEDAPVLLLNGDGKRLPPLTTSPAGRSRSP